MHLSIYTLSVPSPTKGTHYASDLTPHLQHRLYMHLLWNSQAVLLGYKETSQCEPGPPRIQCALKCFRGRIVIWRLRSVGYWTLAIRLDMKSKKANWLGEAPNS